MPRKRVLKRKLRGQKPPREHASRAFVEKQHADAAISDSDENPHTEYQLSNCGRQRHP